MCVCLLLLGLCVRRERAHVGGRDEKECNRKQGGDGCVYLRWDWWGGSEMALTVCVDFYLTRGKGQGSMRGRIKTEVEGTKLYDVFSSFGWIGMKKGKKKRVKSSSLSSGRYLRTRLRNSLHTFLYVVSFVHLLLLFSLLSSLQLYNSASGPAAAPAPPACETTGGAIYKV